MPIIQLNTTIHSTMDICFDLSRSIDLHKISTAKTKEEAVAGKTSGLLDLNDTVTWEATHFGIRQHLTSKITVFDRPNRLIDEQIKGIFKSITHEHRFEQVGEEVLMTDLFEFYTPFGILGRLMNKLILVRYLKKFLVERNLAIKNYAETDQWKTILNGK